MRSLRANAYLLPTHFCRGFMVCMMQKKLIVLFLLVLWLIQWNIITISAKPISLPENLTTIEEGNEVYLLEKKHSPYELYAETQVLIAANTPLESKSENHHPLRLGPHHAAMHGNQLHEPSLVIKPSGRKPVYAHGPEDIVFMLTSLILVCFHLFFMDIFVRMTRARFQNNTKYQYLSTIHLFLSFLVCAVYFLLILLHYRDSEYCN